MRTASASAMVIAIMYFASLAFAQTEPAWLGASVQVLNKEDTEKLGVQAGLKVTAVKEKSPALEAGLEVGDVILSAGEAAVTTIEEFGKVISAKRPGDLLSLGVRRANGRTEPLLVTLGRESAKDDEFADDARVKELREQLRKLDSERRRIAADLEKRVSDLRSGKATKTAEPTAPTPRVETPRPTEPKPEEPKPEEPKTPEPAKLAVSLGATLQDLELEESRKLSLEGGVKITAIIGQGAAEEAGLKVGDVLVKVGGDNLTGKGQLRVLLAKMNPGDKLDLEILRDGKKQTIGVTLRPAK